MKEKNKPTTKKKRFKIGIWSHKRKAYKDKDKDIIGPDPDIIKDFQDAINKPFPKR